MDDQQVLNWLRGAGWLVLSGGQHRLSDVRAQALSRITLIDGGVVYVVLDDDQVDDLIEDMGELGAPTGYLVNILTEDDDTIRAEMQAAALIVIPGESVPDDLHSALTGAAIEGIREAFMRGAVILVEGRSITVFGQTMLLESGDLSGGLGWVANALVVPAITTVAESEEVRRALAMQAATVAIGIAQGSALALGPDGRVETWGEKQVTIALGGIP
jgi:hypothetical protein